MSREGSRLKSWQAGGLLGVLLGLLIVPPLALGAVSAGEGRVYDLLLRTRPSHPDPRVLIVGIDDITYATLGNRMPTRAEMGTALGRLWNAGASLVAFDLILDAPSIRGEEDDAALEAALSKADAVLAAHPSAGSWPVARFRKQAVGLGSIDVLTDRDGVLRRLPPPYVEPVAGGLKIPSPPFALACAKALWVPKSPPAPQVRGENLLLGGHAYPLTGEGWLIPFCGGDGTLPRLSFSKVLDAAAPLPPMQGKIVLVGSTREIQHDLFPIPLPASARTVSGFKTATTHTMAGVEVHGQALSALLRGEAIAAPSPGERALLLVLVSALGTLLAMFPLRPAASLAAWAVFALFLVGSALLAIRHGRAVPLLALALCWLLYAGTSFAYHRYRDFNEKRAVQRLFAHYVSPNVARELLINPELVQLGGRRKELTILFADIRGFTTLSERLPPEQVSALLNEHFAVMTEVLFRFDGTLDKFIGDAVLAFFGDPVAQPDHPARALACAVAMQEEAAALRARFAHEGKPPLHIGIAVHTGAVIVGNNGSKTNFLYTVIGDAVNLTARLQGLAVKDDVITTLSTAERIEDFQNLYATERLEPVTVKGKADPIPVVRVVSRTQPSTFSEGDRT